MVIIWYSGGGGDGGIFGVDCWHELKERYCIEVY